MNNKKLDDLKKREEHLSRLIVEMGLDADKKKWSRVVRTFVCLTAGVFILGVWYSSHDILSLLIASPIAAFLVLCAALLINGYIVLGALKEEKHIATLKGERDALTRYINAIEADSMEDL